MQLSLGGEPIDQLAIEVLRCNAPKDGYRVAYSGGKDSCVTLDLVKRSGVPFKAVYRFVPIDPPELRHFIYEQRRDASNNLTIRMPKRSLLEIGRERGVMPLRNMRWCCEVLKEDAGDGGVVVTGVRWAESARRRRRRMVESCRRSGEFFVHPLIAWSSGDVWDYIHERKLPYCSLYDEGWKRLGCVLCPMVRDVERQSVRWPGIVRVWRKINDAIWHTRHTRHFTHPDQQWEWWLNRDAKSEENDCPLFDGLLTDEETES